MSAPAGWYPDPAAPGRHRWWDGAQWTAHQQPVVTAPAYRAPAPHDIPTGTVWVWLAIAASVVPFLVVFLIDWNGYLDGITGTAYGYSNSAELIAWQLHTMAVSLISWAAIAAFIVFSWLDWRELRRRGVAAPFHWAWSFFALLSAGMAVYMIGRAVVLKRRTVAGGWPPLWTWIGATVVGYILVIVWVVWLVQSVFTRLGVLSLSA